ncbi:hypothetical protein HMPREF0321_1836 [Dermacoccus sp. Ellin185]|nr:hypothetical protein HMPREF0321_1836 [Dermacoccus sp. Ellin185]
MRRALEFGGAPGPFASSSRAYRGRRGRAGPRRSSTLSCARPTVEP